MKSQFLEAGQIVNTHGIKGEVKIVPWCDSPEFLCGFPCLYIDGSPVKILHTAILKGNVLAAFEGVDDINAAMRLKGKTVSISRDEVQLPQGHYFIADLIGLEVRDAESGAVLGTLVEVLTPPAQRVYAVKGEQSYLIPAVEEFVVETNVDGGYLRVKLIEGMASDV